MSMGSSRLANMGPRVGWATLALVLEIVLPVVLVSLATHPTTRAIVGAGADRVRVESQSLRQRHLERRQREEAAASLTREEKTVPGEGPDEAWAQAARAEDVD